MNEDLVKYIKKIIERDSFQYLFESYTDFENVEDDKFHELRLNYLAALKDLQDYIGIE